MVARTDRHNEVIVGWSNCCEGSRFEFAETLGRALPAGEVGLVGAGDLDARNTQFINGCLTHTPLTERRQHVGDVVEKSFVRPDNENAIACEASAVFEEEVGRTVQRNRGLSGTRTTLDNEHLVDVRANDDVLLTLDRRNDLAHFTAAFGADFGEDRVGDATGNIARFGIVELLVEIGNQLAVAEGKAAAEIDAERVDCRCAVEGCRNRGTPVDDDGVMRIVFDVASADVPFFVVLIDPTEEVASAGTLKILDRHSDGDLDVLLRDRVGGTVRVDGRQPFDHPVTRLACKSQPGALVVEVGEEVGAHRADEGSTR